LKIPPFAITMVSFFFKPLASGINRVENLGWFWLKMISGTTREVRDLQLTVNYVINGGAMWGGE